MIGRRAIAVCAASSLVVACFVALTYRAPVAAPLALVGLLLLLALALGVAWASGDHRRD